MNINMLRVCQNDEEVMRAAHHEAGHAVAACVLGLGMMKRGANIQPDGNQLGIAWTRQRGKFKKGSGYERKNLISSLAGAITEAHFCRQQSPEFRFLPSGSPSPSDLFHVLGSLMMLDDSPSIRKAFMQVHRETESGITDTAEPLNSIYLVCHLLCSETSTEAMLAHLTEKGRAYVEGENEKWFTVLSEAASETRELIRTHWSRVERIASELSARKSLSGPEIERFCRVRCRLNVSQRGAHLTDKHQVAGAA